MLPRAIVLSLLLAATLAGCVSGDEPAPSLFTTPDNPIPVEDDTGTHSHRDPTQHRFALNATLLGHDNLQRFGASTEAVVGAHALAIHENLLAVAVNGGDSDQGQQGFHLYNVSDPQHLQHLSFWDAGVPVNGDRTIAFSGDGKTVFLGFEGAGIKPGVAAIDVSDPVNPQQVAFWDDPQDFGSHTISAGVVGGVQYVFSLAVGVNILRYDAEGFALVGKYVAADGLGLLDAYQFIDPSDPENGYARTYAIRTLYGHDMNFYQDPDTGIPLLLVAYAYDGLKILDISQPTAPILLANWMPPADSEHKHYTHSVTAERTADGSLIIVAGSETFEDQNNHIASPIWILDATQVVLEDTANPVHLSTWRNPSEAPAGRLGLSVHFFRQQDGMVYLSHYHGGVWAIDISTPELRKAPRNAGYIMPVPEHATPVPEDCCIGWDLDGAPMVFDVEVSRDGTVFAADLVQGVTSIRFD